MSLSAAPSTAGDAQAYADEAIAQGSQSFAAASRLFHEGTRRDVAKLYAWCRHCDDVVDGQALGHGRVASAHSPAGRLQALEEATAAALDGGSANHPAFAALRDVAERHAIPKHLPFDHLAGFRMDAEGRRFATLDELLSYCYGVAGVVGVMMAHVMGARAEETLDRACDLGLAFQLTNISRDVVEDAENGRLYLPLDWLEEAGVPADEVARPEHRAAVAGVARKLVESAEPYYASAQAGIADLPFRAAWAVDTARGVYRAIGRKVLSRGPRAWDSRARTNGAEKIILLIGGGAGALRSRRRTGSPRPAELWTRPRHP
ncbi:MAG TPA: phytoene/squalene synthase family protein [Mesorhizobium sp.]|jgi:phytoene synthase|nr:phytoene/squalene synthase family protein [Mesorhizobium sp.]